MKSITLLAILLCTLLALPFWGGDNQNFRLKTGDLSFIEFNSEDSNHFSIKTHVDLYPNTEIQFTDTEWDGQKFGSDESNLIWDSGKNTIKANTVISFSKKGKKTQVSIGKAKNSIKIAQKTDAIFAYVGDKRLPTVFLAAMATNKLGYGTLQNTGLVEGLTAITLDNDDVALFSKY